MIRREPAVAVALALIPLLAGCSARGNLSDGPGDMTVFAASSLKKPVDLLAKQFEEKHPGLTVKVNYSGSATLVQQLDDGAPADILMTADAEAMRDAEGKKLVSGSQEFATNTLTLAVAPGNPKRITGLDASLTGVRLVVCAVQVPCGRAANALAAKNNVVLAPASTETNVSDVAMKVANGQADAGLVYTTDVASRSNALLALPIPHSDTVVNHYRIAPTMQANKLAQDWMSFLVSRPAEVILREAGFGPTT